MDLRRLNPFSKKKSGETMYPLPISGGYIPGSWNWNWWQEGKAPLGGGTTVTVQACTDAYAHTLATLLSAHYKVDENGTREYIETSALARILHKPNGYQTSSDFLLNYVKTLMLKGNSYAVGIRNARNEFESLHIVPEQSTMPYIDDDSGAVFYSLGKNPLLGDIDSLVPARDVMHMRLYTPRNPLVGVTPIEHAAASIAANSAISNHQASFFNNMSRPSGVLSTEQKLSPEQMKQLRIAWEEQSKNLESGGIPILANGIGWEQMAMTSIDSQLVEAFNMTTVDIARAYRMPLPLVQQHDQGSTYNNVEQLYNQWLAGGLGFLIEHVEQNYSAFFDLPRKQGTEFDTDTLLRSDFKGKVEGITKGIQGGLFTPNEGRKRMSGLKPVPNGDEAYMQQQMVPLGWTENQAAEPEPDPEPPPVDEPDEEVVELALRGGKDVMKEVVYHGN